MYGTGVHTIVYMAWGSIIPWKHGLSISTYLQKIVDYSPLAWTGQKLLKKCPKNRNIFLVPLNIPELVSREIFLIGVRLPGGAAIIFAQSWNFVLIFFVDKSSMKKQTLQVWEDSFCPKMGQTSQKIAIEMLHIRAAVRTGATGASAPINIWMPQS